MYWIDSFCYFVTTTKKIEYCVSNLLYKLLNTMELKSKNIIKCCFLSHQMKMHNVLVFLKVNVVQIYVAIWHNEAWWTKSQTFQLLVLIYIYRYRFCVNYIFMQIHASKVREYKKTGFQLLYFYIILWICTTY